MKRRLQTLLQKADARCVRFFKSRRRQATQPYIGVWITGGGVALKILELVIYYCFPPTHCAGWYLHRSDGDPKCFKGALWWFCDPPSRPPGPSDTVVLDEEHDDAN